MTNLRAIEFWSGTLPGGETVTLHTGNERVFDDADAAYLLAEYPERFERVTENATALSADNVSVAQTIETETESAPAAPNRTASSSRKKG